MTEVIIDRATRFNLPAGAQFQVLFRDGPAEAWEVKMEEQVPMGWHSVVEIRLLVTG